MRLPRASELRRDFLMVCTSLAVVASARSSLADHYFVPTGSMLPTVEPGDHIVVDKLAYGLHAPFTGGAYALHFSPPARGDVVVLLSPDDGIVLLKRVVGVPGDRVTITDGTVVIDGQTMPVREKAGAWVEELGAHSHAINLGEGGGPDFGPERIPEGRYLVLGDNRGNSRDGRYFGLVNRDAILGRAQGIVLRHGTPTWLGLAR